MDEGVVGRAIDVGDLTEGVVFVVVRTDSSDRSAVRREGREGKIGLACLTGCFFTVSMARPPPMAKTMSAFLKASFSFSASAFSKVASPP